MPLAPAEQGVNPQPGEAAQLCILAGITVTGACNLPSDKRCRIMQDSANPGALGSSEEPMDGGGLREWDVGESRGKEWGEKTTHV